MHLTFSLVLTLSAVCLLTTLSGCPKNNDSKPAEREPRPDLEPTEVTLTEEATVEETPADDPAAVEALEALEVKLTTDSNGNVVAADCKNASITDADLEHFKGLPSLVKLSLENGEITSDGLVVLESLPQITELSLRRCSNVDASGLEHLKKLPNLERLYLLYTRTNNDGLAHVGELNKLKVLDLRGCMEVGDEGLKHLESLNNLVDLKLRSYAVTDAGMDSVGKLTKLRYLAMEDCGVGDDGMQALEVLKDLRVLNVMRTVVGDEGLTHMGDQKLQDLRVRETAVTGPGLESLEGSHESLKYLDISETLIDNDGVSKIAPFTNLETLILWNGSMDDEGIGFLTGLTKLKTLDLQGCQSVTSASADHLLNIKDLESLNLAETSFNDEGLLKLTALSNLKSISVGRSSVTNDGVEKFKAALPNCTVKQ
ncbi:hypothetical protein AB1L42_15130 [Thalassoglobus sp. JC818]|uniref:hypothetical protein n=1 Tax=Thalassoglobus sp. JC818 TaxID=3232136 RepID=UPI0034584CDD